MPKKSQPTYQQVSAELDAILMRLQQPDIQVDEAVHLYEQGLALAAALEKYLEQAENVITKLKVQTGKVE